MFDRRYLKGSLLLGLALSLMGCSSPSLVSIQITPSTGTAYFGYAPGLSRQFTATGTFAQGSHPKTTRDITAEVTWKSDAPGIATISSTGLVTTTGVDYGITDITASMNGFTGLIVAQSSAQVCAPSQSASTSGC